MLLGEKHFIQSLDSLLNIEIISRKLSGDYTSTVLRLVMNNTMFPLYRPFSTIGWRSFANSTACPPNRNFLFKLPGGRKWRTDKQRKRSFFLEPVKGEQRFLRLCPECTLEDNSIYGEPYWHRSHQIYGINLCHKHGLILVETTIEIMTSANNIKYVLPNIGLASEANYGKQGLAMQRIAQTAHWLLNFQDDLITVHELKKLYECALSGKGHILNRKYNSLPFGLEDYFHANEISTDPIKQLFYDTFIWMKCLVAPNSFDAHPVDHLIFLDYLGLSTKQLIRDQDAP